jgi:hypothetical protein
MLNKNSLSVIAGTFALSLLHRKTNTNRKGGSMSQIEILEQIDDANWLIKNNRTEFVEYAIIEAQNLAEFQDFNWSAFKNLRRITIAGASLQSASAVQKIKVGNIFNKNDFALGISLTFKGVLIEDPENILNSAQISVLILEDSPFEFFDWTKINRNGKWANLVIRDDKRKSGLNYNTATFIQDINKKYPYNPKNIVSIPNEVFESFKDLIYIDSSLPILLPDTINTNVTKDSWGSLKGLRELSISPVVNEFFPKFSFEKTLYKLSIFPASGFNHQIIDGRKALKLMQKFPYLTKETSYRWDSGDLVSLLREWNQKSSNISELRRF